MRDSLSLTAFNKVSQDRDMLLRQELVCMTDRGQKSEASQDWKGKLLIGSNQ